MGYTRLIIISGSIANSSSVSSDPSNIHTENQSNQL